MEIENVLNTIRQELAEVEQKVTTQQMDFKSMEECAQRLGNLLTCCILDNLLKERCKDSTESAPSQIV